MLPSGSTRPDQPIWNVSYVPASALLSEVTKSVESITTLIPTAFSCDCRNCAWRRATVPVGTIRCTVGFETPDAATSFRASAGSYGVHLTLASYQALDGEIGVQPGRTVPPNTTLFIAFRSIASSNALRRLALDAIGVPTVEYGSLPSPFLLPRLSVIP